MKIQNYEVIKQIGSGGMGTVYLARDPRLQRLVAIKKIKLPPDTQSDTRSELITRFYREARALASLNHPNIVSVYDLGEENNECYMVMEYLDGKDLDSLLRDKGIFSIDFTISVLLQVCDALYYIHQKQLIHRDVKPANMIYCKDNTVKLMDFGLVRRDDNINLTRVGMLMGSISFMSPEQIQDPDNIDHRVDMYAFGVTMYQFLSNNFPYSGHNPLEIIRKLTLDEPDSILKFNPLVPKELENILMKTIEKDKRKRFNDMLEVKQALINFKNNISSINSTTIVRDFDYDKIKRITSSVSNNDKTFILTNTNTNEKSSTVTINNPSFWGVEFVSDSTKNTLHQKKQEYFENKSTGIKVSQNVLDLMSKEANNKVKADVFEIDYIYPESFYDINTKDIEILKKIESKNNLDISDLKKTLHYLEHLNNVLSNEIKDLEKEIKPLSMQKITYISEFHSKLEIKQKQKQNKEKDLILIKEKLELFKLLLNSKELRNTLNSKIIEFNSKTTNNSFFDTDKDVFSLTSEDIDNVRQSLENKISTLDFFKKAPELVKEYFSKMQNYCNLPELEYKPYAQILTYYPQSNQALIKILQDITNRSLIEIDTNENSTLFIYAAITREGRYVARGKKGEDVLMNINLFDENLEDFFKIGNNIYLSSTRKISKNIFIKEQNNYKNLSNLLNSMKILLENNINSSFDNLLSIFFEPDLPDIKTFELNKQNIIIKSNKVKKLLLDTKREFETSEKPSFKEFSRQLNNTFLAFNRFPAVIKSIEDGIKNQKDQRKRLFQNIIAQLTKATPELLRANIETMKKTITNINIDVVPEAIVDFLYFYLLYKAKLPTNVSKDTIIQHLNQDKTIFQTLEIDYICKLIDLNYNKEVGFFNR